MDLLSVFKRRPDSAPRAAAVSDAPDAVQQARTRARQRLIGAAVLVIIGIIGFPIVFETQPRPIPVDIPIEVPRKDNAPPLAMPPARSPAAAASVAAPAAERPSARGPATSEVVIESQRDAGREVATPPASAGPTGSEAAAPAPRGDPKPDAKADSRTAKPAETKADPATAAADAARARALLDGKSGAASDSGRFVVQVGAFADAGAARETRARAEKLGLKTYTQVADTAAGSRIRVRVGPFTRRDEADRALAKARAAGLTAVVLTL